MWSTRSANKTKKHFSTINLSRRARIIEILPLGHLTSLLHWCGEMMRRQIHTRTHLRKPRHYMIDCNWSARERSQTYLKIHLSLAQLTGKERSVKMLCDDVLQHHVCIIMICFGATKSEQTSPKTPYWVWRDFSCFASLDRKCFECVFGRMGENLYTASVWHILNRNPNNMLFRTTRYYMVQAFKSGTLNISN